MRPEHVERWLFFVGAVGRRPAFQNGNHLAGDCFGAFEVLLSEVAALLFGGAGHIALEAGNECEHVIDELDGNLGLHIAHEEIETGTAPHGANVYDLVGKLARAHIGCEQVLEAMDGGVGQIGAAVRLNHANVISGHVAVNA